MYGKSKRAEKLRWGRRVGRQLLTSATVLKLRRNVVPQRYGEDQANGSRKEGTVDPHVTTWQLAMEEAVGSDEGGCQW